VLCGLGKERQSCGRIRRQITQVIRAEPDAVPSRGDGDEAAPQVLFETMLEIAAKRCGLLVGGRTVEVDERSQRLTRGCRLDETPYTRDMLGRIFD